MPSNRSNELALLLNIKVVSHHGSYLGLPTFVGKSKFQVIQYVSGRVWKIKRVESEVLVKSWKGDTHKLGCTKMGTTAYMGTGMRTGMENGKSINFKIRVRLGNDNGLAK